MPDLVPIRRALISVSDKAGIIDFARALAARGIEIISTGGTAKALADAGINVIPIEGVTRFPEMMDGRVKTLHPMIHAGILAVRNNTQHLRSMKAHGITPIDLVCVNLYPFEETVAKPGVTLEEAIENIDIGGPTLIRAAAKNWEWVAAATSSDQYADIIAELDTHGGCTTRATRFVLAHAVFDLMAYYDMQITGRWLVLGASDEALVRDAMPRLIAGTKTRNDTRRRNLERSAPESQPSAAAPECPQVLNLQLTRLAPLRYGENPHQVAGVYRDPSWFGPSLVTARQLHGKELSYNNLSDASAAMALAADFARLAPDQCGAVVVKHTNPCGAAVAPSAAQAVDLAMIGDPLAAYGGILVLNRPLDLPAAERLCREGVFLEVIVAPSFAPGAAEALQQHSKMVRLLALGDMPLPPRSAPPSPALRGRGQGEGSATRSGSPRPPSEAGVAGGGQPHAPHPNLPPRSLLQHLTLKLIPGGALVQTRDDLIADPTKWEHKAGPAPTTQQLNDAAVIDTIAKHLTSNAIAIGGREPTDEGDPRGYGVRLFGAGAGQMDRVTACRLAIEKAGPLTRNTFSIAASDAFFPFPDGPQHLIDAGVKLIVHPGGSKRDDETFRLCDKHGVTCMTTGIRHFRH